MRARQWSYSVIFAPDGTAPETVVGTVIATSQSAALSRALRSAKCSSRSGRDRDVAVFLARETESVARVAEAPDAAAAEVR